MTQPAGPGWGPPGPPGPPVGPAWSPTPGPPPPRRSNTAVVVTLVVLAALLAAYVVAVIVTRDHWLGAGEARDRVTVEFTAQPRTGTPPGADELDDAAAVIAARVTALGGTDVKTTVASPTITVSAVGVGSADVEGLGVQGQMYLRPVIHVIPSQSADPKTPTTGTAPPDAAQRIADEKALRQSTDQSIQVLAIQFQATRCNDPDSLAGLDDPTLPLVTCSSDDREVYLLGPSIIDNSGVTRASARKDDQTGTTVVDVEFTPEAATTWSDFTEANIGQRTAFTVDTEVLSAPEIREAITGGRTQIAGNFMTSEAEDLASVLARGGLPFPLTAESSSTEPGPPPPSPMPWRIALIAAGGALLLATIGSVVFLAGRRRVR